MAKVWLTYAWDDNRHGDVDYVAQELEAAGLTVKLDRWNIAAGKRLWEQIASFIENPSESDAWLLVATANSLASEPCKEEFAYALDRALSTRGGAFPVMALFPGPVDPALVPAAVRTRLYVSLTDRDWKERIKAAAEGRPHHATRQAIEPYVVRVHSNQPGPKPFAIEMRPRAGVWAPFFAAIPMSEKDGVDPSIMNGPADLPPSCGFLMNTGSGPRSDGVWWNMVADNQASPTQSYYLGCKKLPSRLLFGVNGTALQYDISPAQRLRASRASAASCSTVSFGGGIGGG